MADDKLDLLDLDDEIDLPDVPEDGALACSARPRRPWLLFGAAVIVIILAIYIIVRIVMHNSATDSVEIDLTAPQPQPEQAAPAPAPNDFAASADKVIAGQPESAGAPVRVVEDRKDVVFKPDAPSAPAKAMPKVEPPKPRPVAKPVPTPAAPAAQKPASKPVVKTQAVATSNFYVQFGSYGTRASAESAQKKLQSSHSGLFASHQFVILAAQLPNGSTTYRLRIGFKNSQDANGFCRNAKSDGLDCYVAR